MRVRITSGLIVPLAILASFYVTEFCGGQMIPPGSAGPNPQVPWLHNGVVFTSTWYTASHPGHAMDFKEDQHGGWLAPDGTPLQGMNRPGTSAGGISQTVVTCIDGDHVFLDSSAYTDMRLLGFRDPLLQGTPVTFFVNITGCDLWISPARLAQMKSDPATHTVVQPLQWKAANQMVDAVRVAVVTGQDHYIDHVFDRATGVCLHAAESSTGAAPQLKYIAPGDTQNGDTQLSLFDLISVRDVQTPWAAEAMPQWTKQFKVLHYVGESRSPNPYLGGPPLQLLLDATRGDVGNGWLGLSTDGCAIIRGQRQFPKKSIYITGCDQFDGFFAGPNALAKLQKGQVLDTDPVTHVQTRVTQADATGVTIESTSAGVDAYRTFDPQSGKLIAFGRTDVQTKIKTSFHLQGEE